MLKWLSGKNRRSKTDNGAIRKPRAPAQRSLASRLMRSWKRAATPAKPVAPVRTASVERGWVARAQRIIRARKAKPVKPPRLALWARRTMRRAMALRHTLAGWRYRLLLVGLATVVLACGYGAYRVWHEAWLRAQSVAMVDGRQITRADVETEASAEGLELGRLDAKATKQVLERVIDRRVLVAAASAQGVAEDTRIAPVRARADEMFLAGVIAKRMVGTPAEASDADVRRFMQAHPNMFALRQTFVVDAVLCVQGGLPADVLRRVDTLRQVEDYLRIAKLPYRRGPQVLDTASLPAEIAAHLAQLPAGKVFVLPQGRGQMVATVEQRIPSVLPEAVQMAGARQAIAQEQAQARMTSALAQMRPKMRITYNNK